MRLLPILCAALPLLGCDPCKDVVCHGENRVCDEESGECVCSPESWEVEGECIVYDFEYKLVGHYPLDGDATPAVGPAASIDGATPAEDHAGNAGGALAFDGEAVVTIDEKDTWADPFFEEAFTMSLWVQVDGTGDDPQTFFYGVPNRPWLFYDHRDSRVKLSYVANGGSIHTVQSGSDPLVLGQWHHLFLVAEGETIAWYIDGEFSDSGDFRLMDDDDIDQTLFGATATPGQGLVGALDDIRIWDRAVPRDERDALYATFVQ